MKNHKITEFSKNISMQEYILIYNEKDWDGGNISEMNFTEKSDFFRIANELKNIFFDILKSYNDECIYIGPFYNGYNYCHWKNLKKFEIVQELKVVLHKKNQLYVNPYKQEAFIEKIIEGNMRYLTQCCFFLKNSQVLIQVGHHTSMIIYAKNLEQAIHNVEKIISFNSNDWHFKIFNELSNN